MQKDIETFVPGEAMIALNQRSVCAHSYAMGYGGDTSNSVIAAAALDTQGYGEVALLPRKNNVTDWAERAP